MAGQQSGGKNVPEISVSEAWKRLSEGGQDTVPALIDVRETWEYRNGHAQGAVNIPMSVFQTRIAEVPTDRDVLFICQVGARSMQVAMFMRGRGLERAINVDGGTDAWQARGLPMER
ncbi:MAG TPA: rhodanese-like domain-containing protein [Ktedonobacterales bacterium]|jgi:rhodanese-related sulfurtransferase|nr:rhodanese-like domain-containing protein [Ktedonobacterales bacterium]